MVQEGEQSNDVRRAYRRRRAFLWVPVIGAVALWYGVTALESSFMGYGAFVRRPFTLLDWILYGLIWTILVVSVWWVRRCPRCGKSFGLRSVEVCPSCRARIR